MNGIERIAKERQRQIDEEGWTAEHDDGHHTGSMAMAACCYAAPIKVFIKNNLGLGNDDFIDPWPWDQSWDRRKDFDRKRQLEIAGALCAAELDRLTRKEERENDKSS